MQMTESQEEIYAHLMTLSESNDSFYYSDQVLQSNTYRIFNYRLAGYSQWLEPSALESRGITFFVDESIMPAVPIALVSWPFEKFFNLNENPFTMDLDLSEPLEIVEKMDGSLISTMFVGGQVWLKSKGSLFSDQATAARHLLGMMHYLDLRRFVDDRVILDDQTVIMEFTAPFNRIVVPYDRPTLTVLGIRDNQTGEYVPLKNYSNEKALRFFVQDITNLVEDVSAFVESIHEMKDIEGFVLKLSTGQRVKIKTDWYAKLHYIKDSINSQRRLFEAVVYDTIDDVRAQFYDDEQAIALIDEMQEKVSVIYNEMVQTVEDFYETNKHLERKPYAIKGQKELSKLHFGLAMSKYIGKEIDYRVIMVKHRKQFGIKDDPEVEANE